jgi:hypothetical protein
MAVAVYQTRDFDLGELGWPFWDHSFDRQVALVHSRDWETEDAERPSLNLLKQRFEYLKRRSSKGVSKRPLIAGQYGIIKGAGNRRRRGFLHMSECKCWAKSRACKLPDPD